MKNHKILTFLAILCLIFTIVACGESHMPNDGTTLPNSSTGQTDSISENELYAFAQAVSQPHIPTTVAPRVKLIMSSGKVYIPIEFESSPSLHEIQDALPVVALYPYNLEGFSAADGWNLSYWDYWNDLEVVYTQQPDSTEYTLYDNYFEVIYSTDFFTPPSDVGEYVLKIIASWVLETQGDYSAEYYIKIVVVEPREPFCGNLDTYHGGSLGLVLRDGFHELLELEKHLPFSCTTDDTWSCPCILQTNVDVQNLNSWVGLDKLRLPFSETIQFSEMLVRDRYADIYVRYTLDDMIFNFNIYPGNTWNAEEIVEGWHDNGFAQWHMVRIATVGDVNIYTETDHDANPDIGFTLSVNGALVSLHVYIPCKNPDTCVNGEDFGWGHNCRGEWVDRQAALDGLMQFEFRTLIQ